MVCDANMKRANVREMAPERVSTCRSRRAKGEWVEKVNDCVKACSSLKGRNFRHEGDRRFPLLLSKEERKGRNGTSKNCRRRYLDTAEEDYQEEALKREVGKKEKKAKKVNKGMRKPIKSRKELETLRRWLWKDKLPYKGGIARRLRMKKKKKAGKKATKRQNNGNRSNIWMI